MKTFKQYLIESSLKDLEVYAKNLGIIFFTYEHNSDITLDSIIIPKEMLSDAQLHGEVELIKCEEGILIKPKAQKSWGDFFSTKLNMNKPIYIDLSEVNEDEFMY